MEVELDGQALPVDSRQTGSAGDLARSVVSELAKRRRVVVAMALDGQPVELADTRPWADRPLDQPGLLTIRSADLHEMCSHVLREGAAHLGRLAQAQMQTVDQLRQGNVKGAAELLDQWLPLWGQLQEAVCKVAALQDWDLRHVPVDADHAQSLIEALAPMLQQLRDVLAEQDFVSVADLLEYETVPLAGRWEDMYLRLAEKLDDRGTTEGE